MTYIMATPDFKKIYSYTNTVYWCSTNCSLYLRVYWCGPQLYD